jgi:hypothetical protein
MAFGARRRGFGTRVDAPDRGRLPSVAQALDQATDERFASGESSHTDELVRLMSLRDIARSAYDRRPAGVLKQAGQRTVGDDVRAVVAREAPA